eukprot:3670504-Amphidinium_carterae.1
MVQHKNIPLRRVIHDESRGGETAGKTVETWESLCDSARDVSGQFPLCICFLERRTPLKI